MSTSAFADVSLGDIADFRNGKTISPEKYTPAGKHPVFGSNGQIARSDEVLYPEPAIVIGRVGAYCGCVHFVPRASWVTDNAIVALPKDGNDIRYLFYLLGSLELQRTAIGSAQPLMTQGGLKVVRTKAPPLAEQKAIAAVLGALDDKIELNRRMNETLEALAQSLFKNWFVDAAATKLPKGWREVPFTETVEILGGGTPKTSVAEFWNGDIPWFSVVDAPTETDIFVVDTKKKITQVGVDNSSTRILPVGITIISARGTVGKVALVGVPMAMNQSCYGLRGTIGKNGYYSYFSTRTLVSTLQQRAHGSVFDTITRDTLAGVQVVAPTEEIVSKFEGLISPLMERIRNNLFESRTLAELRDTLLPKLLSGELRVPLQLHHREKH